METAGGRIVGIVTLWRGIVLKLSVKAECQPCKQDLTNNRSTGLSSSRCEVFLPYAKDLCCSILSSGRKEGLDFGQKSMNLDGQACRVEDGQVQRMSTSSPLRVSSNCLLKVKATIGIQYHSSRCLGFYCFASLRNDFPVGTAHRHLRYFMVHSERLKPENHSRAVRSTQKGEMAFGPDATLGKKCAAIVMYVLPFCLVL
jgi:hypothetical protein